MNRLSYPRKFAVTGMLFALPLAFVTTHYITLLNEHVELNRREQAGIRAVRTVIPLWRLLNEQRRLSIEEGAVGEETRAHRDRLFRETLESELAALKTIDDGCRSILSSSARWGDFESKIASLLSLNRTDGLSLTRESVLTELIRDLLIVFRQVADVSDLTTDSHSDSQTLAVIATERIPELIEYEYQCSRHLAEDWSINRSDYRFDLDAIQALVGLQWESRSIHQKLQRLMLHDEKLQSELKPQLDHLQSSINESQRMMNERIHFADRLKSQVEFEELHRRIVQRQFDLQKICLAVFDEMITQRRDAAQARRTFLMAAALIPVVIALYLGIGFCLSVIRTVDRMRDLTDRVLENDWRESTLPKVEAQDELGHMIGHFGRLTARLREEWEIANAEALRATEAEELLRVSEQRFALALRGTNDGIWDWDLQTDHVFYSTRFKELLGYEDNEFGVWLSALADVLHPDDFDCTWTAVERHLRERVPYHIEHRLRNKNGEYRWYLERGQAVWDEAGNAIRMAGSISDIHDRRMNERNERIRNGVMEALTQGASLPRVLDKLVRELESESSSKAISIQLLDREGRRLLTGAAPSLPDFYSSAIHGLEIGPNVGSCGAAAWLKERVVVEEIQTHPNWIPYRDLAVRAGLASCWSEPIFGESGSLLGTFAIYGSRVGLPFSSDIQTIEFGVRLAALAIERKMADEERRQYLLQVEQSRDQIAEQSIELVRQAEELARAKDRAEAAARAKSEFLANMSHELRTPLTAILGYADVLHEQIGQPSPLKDSLETIDVIRTNGRHLQALIDDILDLSKIEAGRMTLERLPVSPVSLTEDVVRLMQLRAMEKNLSLTCEFLYPLPDRINTDALRVRQILVNLVGNAIKFTSHGGVTITVEFNKATSSLRFSVSDTGIGMSADQIELLFAPFTQADTSMSRRFGGTGLGLSISQRLAHILGGEIRVESQAGVGSTFTLVIGAELSPNAEMIMGALTSRSEKQVAPEPVAKPPAVLNGRILLAEDVPANQKLISFLLQKQGAEVEIVENGRQAIEKALRARQDGKPFDLILMDIQMPEMDGYTATGALREFDYDGRIVALTAHATEGDRQRCLDSGFDGFAVKPIQKEQLIATCREHMGLRHLQTSSD